MNYTMDPHDWVYPKNAKIMVENIYQGLVQIDPAIPHTTIKIETAILSN